MVTTNKILDTQKTERKSPNKTIKKFIKSQKNRVRKGTKKSYKEIPENNQENGNTYVHTFKKEKFQSIT